MYFVITISYDGSKFYGFQRLKGLPTVQKYIEEALSKINKKEVVIKGAGRTDRGVHALGQRASFKLDIKISDEGLKKALNSLIKPYIYVRKVEEVDENFHARFNVLKKQYCYKINLGEYNPMNNDYMLQIPYKLDVDRMKEVANLYLGIHDFHNFVAGDRVNNTAIIYDINFKYNNDVLEIRFVGKSFYRYMVRNLVGMMIEVGRGKEDIKVVKEMLNTDKKMAGVTVFAGGLYLENIEYNDI